VENRDSALDPGLLMMSHMAWRSGTSSLTHGNRTITLQPIKSTRKIEEMLGKTMSAPSSLLEISACPLSVNELLLLFY